MKLTSLTDLVPGPVGVASRVFGFIKRHLPAFLLLLPLVAAIVVGMSVKGENRALKLQVQLEQTKTAKAQELADSRLTTINTLKESARLQQKIQDISDEAQSRTAAASFWHDAAQRLRRQSTQTGCVVPAQPAGVPAGAAQGDGLADGAGNADRLVELFAEADRTTQKLIGLQAAWSLITKQGQCPDREPPAGP